VAWAFALLPSPLALVGVVLLIGGGSGARVVGIVLLVLFLLGMTVPISPFLKARVRRRETRAEREQ
jgi:cytochrome c biogenesis protein CcdA